MNHDDELLRLCEFVREIRRYYRMDQQIPVDRLIVSKAMVSFALHNLSEPKLNDLIETLKKQGYIVSASNDQLVFSGNFPKALC